MPTKVETQYELMKNIKETISDILLYGIKVPLSNDEIERALRGYLHALKVFFDKIKSLGAGPMVMVVENMDLLGIAFACLPKYNKCPGEIVVCNVAYYTPRECWLEIEKVVWPFSTEKKVSGEAYVNTAKPPTRVRLHVLK